MKFIFLVLMLFTCVEKEFDPNDAKKSYGIAKEPYDDENYERAVTRLQEFKTRFPHSQYTIDAELLIADAQFKLGKFPEAAASYEQFVKLHPKHPQVDFAMNRQAESFWNDAPEQIDRDQEFTQKAVDQWKLLIEKFPKSQYVASAKEFIEKGRRRMAEASQFAARFYCKRGIYHACAYRYMKLLETYPEFTDITQKSLKDLVYALEKVAVMKEKDPESDKNLFVKNMTAQQIREKADNFKKMIR